MVYFETALKAFARGELDAEGLGQRLDEAVSQAPEQAPALVTQIEDSYRAGDLPVAVYEALTERIGRFEAPTQLAAQGPRPQPAAVESTPAPSATEAAGEPGENATVTGSADAPRGGDAATRVEPTPSVRADQAETEYQPSGSDESIPPEWHAQQPKPVGIGSVINNRFVLEEAIAAGGMGAVYKARDLRKEEAQDRDPHVAIKVLGEEFRKHPDSFRALQRESKKAQRLAHPNIVTVYDFDRDGTTFFMTMEYLRGESLEEIIKRTRGHGLPKDEVLPMVQGIARGLAYAHEQGIVHSDLKPGNVFVTEAGVVKLLDFGIARAAKRPGQAQDTTLFDAGSLGALTPAYASCEMFEGQDPDPRDDIYALACMTYELLAGHHPFNKVPAVHARDGNLQPEPIKGISAAQWKSLQQGLVFDREQRTPDAETFLKPFTETPGSSWGLWLGLGSLALIGLGVGAFVFYAPQPAPVQPGCSAPPVPARPLSALDAETRKRVERLLTVAEAHMMVGRLTEPPGSNAYTAYQQVMDVHPDDAKAWKGYKDIADRLVRQARAHVESGDFKAGMEAVNQGLTVCPDYDELLSLKQQIDDARN